MIKKEEIDKDKGNKKGIFGATKHNVNMTYINMKK